MSGDPVFSRLLHQVRAAYQAHPQACDFAPFPDDVHPQQVEVFRPACAEAFQAETRLKSQKYGALQHAIADAGQKAKWRETYKDTDIGPDFMARFGCFTIIGEGGPFHSDHLRAWMVYMPAGLYYPWHHHPAEELYLVVAGNAVFRRKGLADAHLGEGATAFHGSNQPHAMQTLDEPILCLVFWRNEFDTAPVLTPQD